MSLRITGLNINGFSSSEPYLRNLICENDVVCISEHWLPGTELFKLNNVSGCVASKCANTLMDGPPVAGRGYGGVAILWKEHLAVCEVKVNHCDRVIAICVKCT